MFFNRNEREGFQGPGRVWRFATCEFDESTRQLRVHGQVVELESKPLDVLQQLLLHAGEVSWVRAALAFAAIDLIGYLPGARAFRRAGKRPIPAVYHHLYNVTHNFLTAAVVTAVWALSAGGLEWAMLALPLHLAGDRGIFGNGFKPVALPFEAAR